MNTKRISAIVFAALVGLILSGVAYSRVTTDIPTDVDEDQLSSIIIEDFEKSAANKDGGWMIDSRPRKLSKEQQDAKNDKAGKKVYGPMVEELAMDIMPGGPAYTAKKAEGSASGDTKAENKVLGAVFKFIYPAANEIYFYPPTNDALKKNTNIWEGRGFILPGRLHQISIWVQGRGYPYTLECVVQDYRGRDHVVRFGSVRFIGWRALKGIIPADLAQNPESNPKDNTAKLTKIILRADPNVDTKELTRRTYFIMDQIKVLTENFDVNYEGKELNEKLDKLVDGSKEAK